MKIEGEHRFEAAPESVFEALLDPEVLARTLPGIQKLDRVGDNEYRGALDIRVGPVQGRFQGKVSLSEIQPPESYRLQMSGQGPHGFVNGDGAIRLEGDGGGTLLRYDVDAQVGGRIAGVGQRLLDSSAKALTRQALEGLEKQVAARTRPAVARPPEGADDETLELPVVEPPPPPSQTEFAAAVARNVLADLVPPRHRPWVIGLALVLYTAVVVLLTRACSG
ncbi:MAG: carbon monoxide dehydrogenase subunit G [Thermoanaerobaculia bacterium]|nr:carbon monoxide dehydrogenase subunit G [Thermoanaerobaculia bacterium]